MRPALYLLLLGASLTTARNLLPISDHKKTVQEITPPALTPQRRSEPQKPMSPADLGPVIPGAPAQPSAGDKDSSDGNAQLTISDILPTQRQINIFAQLTRDISSLTSRLESSLPSGNTTLLAPLNSAMSALPRKPWEDSPDDTSEVSAERDESKAARNLRRFVLEHVVPVSPWEEGRENAVRTLWSQEEGGEEGEIWWETRKGGSEGETGRRVIMPGEIVVDRVAGRVGNGEIWSLKQARRY